MATDELYPVFRAAVEDHSTIEPVTTTKTVSVPPPIEALAITAFCPDGWLRVADSTIPEQVMRSGSHIKSQAPSIFLRFRPGFAGIPGH